MRTQRKYLSKKQDDNVINEKYSNFRNLSNLH